MKFGTTFSCTTAGTSSTDIYTTTTGTNVGQGPALSRCPTATVGTGFLGTTPMRGNSLANGEFACYQFTIASQVTLGVQVNLPAGVTGLAELYIDASTGAGYKVAGSTSLSPSMSFSFTNANARAVLVVKTDNGGLGQPIGIGIGATAPTPPTNNAPASAYNIQIRTYAKAIESEGLRSS